MIQDFELYGLVGMENGIGGTTQTLEKVGTFTGYLDMLSGDTTKEYNTYTMDSTHVLLTKYDRISFKDIVKDTRGWTYTITFIDNPVGMSHHLEVYLKRVDNNEV